MDSKLRFADFQVYMLLEIENKPATQDKLEGSQQVFRNLGSGLFEA